MKEIRLTVLAQMSEIRVDKDKTVEVCMAAVKTPGGYKVLKPLEEVVAEIEDAIRYEVQQPDETETEGDPA